MKFYAELKNKKELEAEMTKLAMAFVALGQDLVAQAELESTQDRSHKPKKAISANKAKTKKTPLL